MSESESDRFFEVDTEKYLPYAIAGAPAALGCAMGILLGGRMKDENRGSAAAVMLGVAAVAAAPFAVDYVKKRLTGPASKRGSARRLSSIRDAGIPEDEYFGVVDLDETVVM